MSAVSSCPAMPQWQRLVQGQLPEREVEPLAEHLARCDRCLAAVQGLQADDTLVAAVQQVRSASPGSRAEAIAQLLQRWRKPSAHPALEATVGVSSAPPASAEFAYLSPPQQSDEIGRLGSYRVLKVLGSGGMGVVFQAEDVQLERPVALKVMKPDVAADPAARQRFLREAKTTARLHNDHIVRIYQVGDANGVVFLAMEFLRGEALDKWLERGRKPTLAQIVRLGREMAKGLMAAHECGLIHRDIKPGNLWLEAPTGRVKILDFGLARTANEDLHLTQTGMIVGTPAYMAPEQARAEAVDHRTDLYSLGCVLYRLCTGRLPFSAANTMALLTALALDTPKEVGELNPQVPPELSVLVMGLLAKKLEERPQSAKAVLEALQAVERSLVNPAAPMAVPVAPRGEPAAPANPWEEVTAAAPRGADIPVCRKESPADRNVCSTGRRRWPLWIGAAGMLAAAVVVGALLLNRTNPDGTGKPVPSQPGDPTQAEPGKPAPPMQPAVAAASPFDRFRRRDIPPHELKVAGSGDPQQAPAEFVAVIGDSRLKHYSGATSVAFSPDGKTLASIGYDALLCFWNPATGQLDRVVRFPRHIALISLAWHPDQTRMALGMGALGMALVDVSTGKELRAFPQAGICNSVRFTADGRQVVTASQDQKARLWDVETGKELQVFAGHEGPLTCAAPSPDGKLLVTGSTDKTARVWDLATGKYLRPLQGVSEGVYQVEFTPDGKHVAVTQWVGGGIGLWDPLTGQRKLALAGYVPGYRVAVSPNGQWLVTDFQEAGPRTALTWWDAATGKKIRSARPLYTSVTSLTFSPDSAQVATAHAEHRIRLWATARGPEVLPLPDEEGFVASLSVSADGKRVAWRRRSAAGAPGVVWDVAQGKPLFQTPIPNSHPALSPDGQWFATGEWGDKDQPRVWNLATGTELSPQQAAPKRGGSLTAFNAQGTELAITDGTVVRIFDPRQGTELRKLSGHTQPVTGLDWSTGANRIATACIGAAEIKVWDPATAKEVVQLRDQTANVAGLRISPDGTRLVVATGTHGRPSVYDLTNGNKLFTPSNFHASYAFSADSRTLAVGTQQGQVFLKDATSGETVRQWQFLGDVTSLAYAPDGRHLLVGFGNSTVFILRLTSSPRPTN